MYITKTRLYLITNSRYTDKILSSIIYRVLLYDDKMKVIFNLKGGQKNELLLNLIFPDYPDGNGGEDENSAKEKEVDISTSNSDVNAECAYTSRVVEIA